jgi:hypothetical protein
LLALLLLLSGCPGASEHESSSRGATPAPPLAGDVSEHLRQLGYEAWDEDADRGVSGVVWHAREKAAPGLNLFTNDVDAVLLMDAEGAVVRRWGISGGRHCEHVELIEGPRLAVVCEALGLVVLEPDGSVAWKLPAMVHHDVAQRPDGSLLVAIRDEPRFHRGRSVEFDALLEVSPEGVARKVWAGADAFEALRARHGETELDEWARPLDIARYAYRRLRGRRIRPVQYYHLNSVEVLGETPLGRTDPRFRSGNVLLGLRNANTAAILDGSTWEPLWHWGEQDLDLPHMPTLLPSGHLLVFDNGTRRGWSRVVELDPVEERIVWQYPEEPRTGFFSEWRGSSQRLPNGNTLICLSEQGRVVEVDSEGGLVWEFWNPDIGDKGRKRIYRVERLPPATAEVLLRASPAA